MTTVVSIEQINRQLVTPLSEYNYLDFYYPVRVTSILNKYDHI